MPNTVSARLTSDNLSDWFTLAGPTNSWYQEPTNTFDFVSRSSDHLLVTIGDSWTWGSDIVKKNRDDSQRRNLVYGNLVSEALSADWLNLGLCNTNNWWLRNRAQELANLLPQLHYQRVTVIAVMTETGRWLNTHDDQDIDYRGWFRDNVKGPQDFWRFVEWQNQLIIQDLVSWFPNATLKIGTNFVDQWGFSFLPAEMRLEQPWYLVMGSDPTPKTFCTNQGLRDLGQALGFIEDPQCRDWFKHWHMDLMPAADARTQLLGNDPRFNNYHPDAQGHRQWADYVLQSLR